MYQVENFKSVHVEQVLVRNTPVYLTGDLHTNYNVFKNNLEEMDLRDCIIIFVGDMDFKDSISAFNQFKKLDKELHCRNITSFVIRGNHDNPVLWDKDSQDYIELWREFKSFTPIGPHTELNINGNIGAVVSRCS